MKIKNLLLILLLATSVIFAGCSQTEEKVVVEPDMKADTQLQEPQTVEDEVEKTIEEEVIQDDTTDDIEIGSLI